MSEQQNIIIQRSKQISNNFNYSVLNVPSSDLTIIGSFNPEKFVANTSELNVYLPVIAPVEADTFNDFIQAIK